MRNDAPALLPIFRSQQQARILAWLLLHPGHESTVADLARRFGLPVSTVHREIQRLSEAGLLRSRAVGRSRLVTVDPEHRGVEPLTRLLELTYGPDVVVGDEFADIAGARLVLVFGSWAARFHGEPGPPPHDVDVLVVGEPDRGAVYRAADRAQERLGLPVNPVIRSPEMWRGDDPLVRQVRSSPYVVVAGDPGIAP
jgi:DNA-binding transcriptional ArsR family regulator